MNIDQLKKANELIQKKKELEEVKYNLENNCLSINMVSAGSIQLYDQTIDKRMPGTFIEAKKVAKWLLQKEVDQAIEQIDKEFDNL